MNRFPFPPTTRRAGVLPLILAVVLLIFPWNDACAQQPQSPPSAATPATAEPATEPASPPEASDPAHQVLAEINRARTQPAAYADFLVERRAMFQDKVLNLPGQDPLETREGVAPLDEAVTALRALRGPLPALEFDDTLAASAAELASDQFKTGQTGHVGSAGGSMATRMARHGTVQGQAGENLAYGTNAPEDIVFSLMVDDGVAGRGHRGNLLNPEFRRVGIVVGPHPEWEHMCVMDFAQGFTEKPQP